MTHKRKSDRCYSERHKRRLVEQQTKLSIARVEQATPVRQEFKSRECKESTIDRPETESGYQNVEITSDALEFENAPPRFETHDSDVNSDGDSVIDYDHHSDIATQFSDIEMTLDAHGEQNPHNIASIAEARDSDHSDDPHTPHVSNDSNQSNDSNDSDTLTSDICNWINTYRPPRGSVNALLRIFRKHTKSKLPKDYRALLKTPRSTEIHSIAGGQYWHHGLEKAVRSIVNKRKQAGHDARNIGLMINIDGAPLGKSSQYSLWPILCSDDVLKKVYVVGAFLGEGKPDDSNQFLDMFINEAVTLVNDGLLFNNEHFNVNIQALICDAPAKAFVLQVKNYNGYNSCTKCIIEGEYLDHTMCFPSVGENVDLRTDADFKNYVYQDDYQIGRTNLARIPRLGLVTNVPLDYMHLVCLGIMKKLFFLWLRGPLKVRLSAYDQVMISRALLRLKTCITSDFVRKPRPLKFLSIWKATEFRQFLLYLGPIVLKNVLKQAPYEHFLILHAAMTILVSPVLSKHSPNVDYAEKLLKHFVESFGDVYSVKYISHNVHNLLHIAEDVRKFGPLDEFSAFKFENYMSEILKLRRKGERPLQQIALRLAEYENISTTEKDAHVTVGLNKPHNDGPLPRYIDKCRQYKVMRQYSYDINCNDSKNNCCLLNEGTMIDCVNFVKCGQMPYIIGYELVKIEDVYSSPCESEIFNIQVVEKDTELQSWPCADMCAKLMKIPLDHMRPSNAGKIAVFPVLHTSRNK